MSSDRNTLLRKRFEVGTTEALIFSYIVVVTLVWWLWSHSSREGLIGWAVAMAVCVPLPKIIQSIPTSFAGWYRNEVAVESVLGIIWGLLPVVAMPDGEVNRALLCAVLLGVLIASSASSSQFFLLHLAFILPFSALSIAAYLMTEPSMVMAAVFVIVALAYSVAMATEHRTTHVELVDLLGENDDLVGELGAERDALAVANEQLDRQAWFDALTGLANRAAMTRDLSELFDGADGADVRVTVAYLDLDGFKQINDTRGHRVGDLVLIAVAERLAATIGSQASVYRLGGDEITVLSSDMPSDRLGEQLAAVFEDPFHIEGRSMPISAGIGVAATSLPGSSEELLRFADRALYRHKDRTDRAMRYRVFDTDMLDELREHEATEIELSAAFDAGEVNAWFQPIVDLQTGRIVAAEALARWEHPSGVRSAAAFISHLAERRLLGELADRSIAQASDLTTLLASHGIDDFRVSVNVPPTEIERVLGRLDGTSVLSHLMIEITEEAATPNVDRVAHVLDQARQAGAKVLVDDIGTGFSSLSLTTVLPIDGLKIDGSFVETLGDVRSRAVVSAIADLGRNLGLDVIAECVELPAQAQRLAELGVGRAQGFLYAPAMPAAEILDLIVSARTLGPKSALKPGAA